MLENDEIAVSSDLVIAVDHAPGTCGADLLTPAACDFKALARAAAFLAEFFKEVSSERPGERAPGSRGGRRRRRLGPCSRG